VVQNWQSGVLVVSLLFGSPIAQGMIQHTTLQVWQFGLHAGHAECRYATGPALYANPPSTKGLQTACSMFLQQRQALPLQNTATEAGKDKGYVNPNKANQALYCPPKTQPATARTLRPSTLSMCAPAAAAVKQEEHETRVSQHSAHCPTALETMQ
jgi:hypothetical protein